MRAYLPVMLVLLAVFTAACIAYVAWELSSDKPESRSGSDSTTDSGSDVEHGPDA
jgi:hypothetical protein